MKKAIRISVSLLVVVMAASSFSFGQEHQKVQKSKLLDFKNESVKTEVKLLISEKTSYLEISIDCNLNQGEASIQIIDPAGKIKGNFSVKTEAQISKGENTRVQEHANGSLNKGLRNPIKGNWKIIVKPKGATGRVTIKIVEHFNTRAEVLEVEQIKGIGQSKINKIK